MNKVYYLSAIVLILALSLPQLHAVDSSSSTSKSSSSSSSSDGKPIMNLIDQPKFTKWSQDFINFFVKTFKTIQITEIDFIKELNIYSDYWITKVEIDFGKQAPTLDIAWETKTQATLKFNFPLINIKLPINDGFITIPLKLENLNIQVVLGSAVEYMFAKQINISLEKIKLDIAIIGSLIPDSVLNNDKVKQGIQNSEPLIRDFANAALVRNRELIKTYIKDQKYATLDAVWLANNFNRIQFFDKYGDDITLKLGSLLNKPSLRNVKKQDVKTDF